MAEHLVDTHALFWYLTAAPQLGTQAAAIMDDAVQGNGLLIIPSIVVAELYYLNAKLGSPLNFQAEFQTLVQAGCFLFVDFQSADVMQFDSLSAVPEMHDRIIVGVARARNIPCLTRDARIVQSGLVPTIW